MTAPANPAPLAGPLAVEPPSELTALGERSLANFEQAAEREGATGGGVRQHKR